MKQLFDFNSIKSDEKIVIYGAGKIGEICLKELKSAGLYSNIKYLVDKQNEKWANLLLKSPKTILDDINNIDKVIIASQAFFEEIKNNLIDSGISPDKILGPNGMIKKKKKKKFPINTIIRKKKLINEKIIILDVGSRSGTYYDKWIEGFGRDNIKIIGFDSDKNANSAAEKIAKELGIEYNSYPCFLGKNDGEIRKFYVYHENGAGAICPPNTNLTHRMQWAGSNVNFKDYFFTREIQEFKTLSLDTWRKENNIDNIDLIKINVDSSEHEIVEGGGDLLKNCLGLYTEVSFLHTYIKRPLFSDLDPLLRKNGLSFFSFSENAYVGRTDSPININRDGQLIECMALYMRDLLESYDNRDIKKPSDCTKFLKLACISEVYNQVEFAFEILNFVYNIFEDKKFVESEEIKKLIDEAVDIYKK